MIELEHIEMERTRQNGSSRAWIAHILVIYSESLYNNYNLGCSDRDLLLDSFGIRAIIITSVDQDYKIMLRCPSIFHVLQLIQYDFFILNPITHTKKQTPIQLSQNTPFWTKKTLPRKFSQMHVITSAKGWCGGARMSRAKAPQILTNAHYNEHQGDGVVAPIWHAPKPQWHRGPSYGTVCS